MTDATLLENLVLLLAKLVAQGAARSDRLAINVAVESVKDDVAARAARARVDAVENAR